jgi:hypothetical protein
MGRTWKTVQLVRKREEGVPVSPEAKMGHVREVPRMEPSRESGLKSKRVPEPILDPFTSLPAQAILSGLVLLRFTLPDRRGRLRWCLWNRTLIGRSGSPVRNGLGASEVCAEQAGALGWHRTNLHQSRRVSIVVYATSLQVPTHPEHPEAL